MNNIFWDAPQGELYNFKDKSELVKFLNKTQLHFDIENFSGNDAHGISIKFLPEEPDDIFGDGEYSAEYLKAQDGEYFYRLPIHNPNPYSNLDEQYAQVCGFHYGICLIKEEDVILDDRWEFPCNAFIWVGDTCDRMGKLSINLFSVWPVGSERTVESSQIYENERSQKQIERLNYFIELEKLEDERRKSENKD